MSQATPEAVLSALRWRYATKIFDPAKKIPDSTWEALEQSLVLTPSSFGLQPWRFYIVKNEEVRERLKAHSWGQSQVTDASHFIVFTARTGLASPDIENWIGRLASVQGTPLEVLAPLKGIIEGFVAAMPEENHPAWNARQLYIALGQFMAVASLLGVDTCPMEGMNPAGYDEVLGLEGSGYTTVVACAVGYRSASDAAGERAKARYEASEVIRSI
jgi:nitroreductase